MKQKNRFRRIAAIVTLAGTLLGPKISLEQKVNQFPVKVEKSMAKAGSFNNLEGRLTVLGFDILFNGLKSGIGAVYHNKDFWPAFFKGALSGMIVYTGKEIASWNYKVPFSGATGKLVHDFGVSMSDNVALGRTMFSRYVTDFGPVELQFQSNKVSFYFHPYPLYAIIKNFANGYKLDLAETLSNLTPVFYFKQNKSLTFNNMQVGGFTQQNVMTYCLNCKPDGISNSLKSHEFNHVLFFSEFRFLDEMMDKKSESVQGMPVFWKFAPVFDYIKLGPFLAQTFFSIPSIFSKNAYWYLPHEFEAYTLNRPQRFNPHPLYH